MWFAASENVSGGYIGNILPFVFLAPDIVEAAVSGNQPVELTADALVKTIKLPTAWEAQQSIIGLR